MCVSRSEVSSRCSIQRESLVTGAKAMSASFEGSGPGSELVRTKRSRSAAGCWPGSTESYRENGASGGERETLRGRSEEHTSELQSRLHLVCRLLLEKKNDKVPSAATSPDRS